MSEDGHISLGNFWWQNVIESLHGIYGFISMRTFEVRSWRKGNLMNFLMNLIYQGICPVTQVTLHVKCFGFGFGKLFLPFGVGKNQGLQTFCTGTLSLLESLKTMINLLKPLRWQNNLKSSEKALRGQWSSSSNRDNSQGSPAGIPAYSLGSSSNFHLNQSL